MQDLFITLALFYLLILIGHVMGRIFKAYNQQLRRIFSFILLFILAPPIIVFSFILPNISLSFTFILNIILFTVILIIVTQLIAFVIFLRNRPSKENKRIGSILMLVSFPNSMLFPLPIVLSVFGTEFIVILIIFTLTAVILRVTWITFLCIHYGETKRNTVKMAVKKMITFPPTIAIFISIFLLSFNVQLEQEIFLVINDVCSWLTTVFGAMLIGILTVNLNLEKIKEFQKDFYIVIFIRIFCSMVLFLFLIPFLTFPSEIRTETLTILLLLYLNPPAVTNTTYAEYFELDKDFTAFCVITITLLAILYVPFILIIGILLF